MQCCEWGTLFTEVYFIMPSQTSFIGLCHKQSAISVILNYSREINISVETNVYFEYYTLP